MDTLYLLVNLVATFNLLTCGINLYQLGRYSVWFQTFATRYIYPYLTRYYTTYHDHPYRSLQLAWILYYNPRYNDSIINQYIAAASCLLMCGGFSHW